VEGVGFDVENGPQFDLADDAAWDPLVVRVRASEFAAAFASPPCTTYSKLRSRPGGPPPVRGVAGACRYGLPGLSVANKELVRKHNIISIRVAELLHIFTELQCPWIFENPAAVAGEVSILNLDEYQRLLSAPSVHHVIGIQCTFGAISSKPTSWVSCRIMLDDMPHKCPHSKRMWFNDRTGVGTAARHRPTAGTDTYSSTQTVRTAPGLFVPRAPFVSAKLAAYPDLLNRYLVAKLSAAINVLPKQSLKRPSPVILDKAPAHRTFTEAIAWRQRLRGIVEPDAKEMADMLAIGGLRNAADSVGRLHTVQAFGITLGDELRKLLMANFTECSAAGHIEDAWVNQTCSLIGTKRDDARPPLEAVEAVKAVIMRHTGSDGIVAPGAKTRINSTLLGGWQASAGDPDNQVDKWLVHGAPAGILSQPKDVGIFPDCAADAEQAIESLSTDWEGFTNYSGVEAHEVTEAELSQHICKGHIEAFDSMEDLRARVCGDPVLSKLGLIIKTRNGKTKARMILDTKASGIKYVTGKSQRVILPRLFDAVLRLLGLMSSAQKVGGEVSAFVLDFSDAFWQIPIAEDELRFFCVTALINSIRKYMVLLRAAQGSRAAPLLWARLAALLMRLTQSLFQPADVNLMCFVDDPLAALRGSELERRTQAAIIMLVWEALDFKLAYHKGQLSTTVTWIGGTLTCESNGVRAAVKEAIVQDVKADLQKFARANVISRKELHSLVGKLAHCAGLLIIMRPFLQPLWAALYAECPTGAPLNIIWIKQISTTLQWLNAFFNGAVGGVERFFRLDAFLRQGPIVEIGTDASPWGLGAWLAVDGVITHYFASPITADDQSIYSMVSGVAEGQQLWECLAVLVAIDVWSTQWQQDRIVLKVRGDNVGALTLLIKMRPSSPTLAIVARELALRLVELSFPPDAVHTPGVSHVIADKLSRVFAPGGCGNVGPHLHPALQSAVLTHVPARDRRWYRALPPEPA
jgi:hypothetical protein